MILSLAQIVFDFAEKTHNLPEYVLNNEGWGWDAYQDIRYGFLHIAGELHMLIDMTLKHFVDNATHRRLNSCYFTQSVFSEIRVSKNASPLSQQSTFYNRTTIVDGARNFANRNQSTNAD